MNIIVLLGIVLIISVAILVLIARRRYSSTGSQSNLPIFIRKQIQDKERQIKKLKSQGDDLLGFPVGWNKTIEDLSDEASVYQVVGPPETDWARNYEKSLIPANTVIPEEKDIYEAKADVEVKYMTSYRAPFTGGGICTLPKGTLIEISHIYDERPIIIYAKPIEYEAMEAHIIPEEERNSQKFAGYNVVIKTIMFEKYFRKWNPN